MQKKMYKYLQIFIMTILVCLTTVPSFVHAADNSDSDKYLTAIKKRGYLIVGTSADYAPIEFHATVDGRDQIVGSDMELAKKIAKDMGVKLVVRDMGFDSLIGALKTGKIDLLLAGLSATPERAKQVAFTNVYKKEEDMILVQKKDQDKYHKLSDLFGKNIGVQKQSVQEDVAKKDFVDTKFVSLTKIPDLVAQLSTGKIDGVVLADFNAKAYVEQNKNLAIAEPKIASSSNDIVGAVPLHAPALLKQVNSTIYDVNKNKLYDKYLADQNKYMFSSKSFFAKYGNFYVTGLWWTLALAVIAIIFGVLFGILFAIMKLSKKKILSWPANIYIEFIRGTPSMVQIYMVFFGTQVLGLNLSAFLAGAFALAINSTAYVAEIIRAGIQAVPKGQMEAARSLGFSTGKAMRYTILPQAIKNILPALGNEFITIIKESSVVSVIGVGELMFQTSVIQGASFKPFFPLVIVSLIYFVLTFGVSQLLRLAERKMRK